MICDNCIHNTVCERATFENHCGYKHTEADVINPELEKIKAEIKQMPNESWNTCCDVVDREELLNKIDRHISELKGEQEC